MLKILVCGGRDFNDYTLVEQTLNQYLTDKPFIIQGGARGADNLAGLWAKSTGSPCAVVPANWDHYNKAAGAIRNRWMLELQPDLVIAFEGGYGTSNMIKQAKQKGIEVIEVKVDE